MVMDLADTVLAVDFGRPIACGTPVEIQNNPDVIRAFTWARSTARPRRERRDSWTTLADGPRRRHPGRHRSRPPAPGGPGAPRWMPPLRVKNRGIWP